MQEREPCENSSYLSVQLLAVRHLKQHPKRLRHLPRVQVPLEKAGLLGHVLAPLHEELEVLLVVVVVDELPHGQVGQLLDELERVGLADEEAEEELLVAGRDLDALRGEHGEGLLDFCYVRPP